MAPASSRLQDHEKEYQRSQKNLELARTKASRRNGYNSDSTRDLLRSEFTRFTGGLAAYTWQIDIAEALLLGLDCSVIAGSGAGKTMSFLMPLFVEREKHVIIISLTALEEDQAKRFNDMGISAIAVNKETWTDEIQNIPSHIPTTRYARALVPSEVPFLVTSATMPPPVLFEIRNVLRINPLDSFHINVGTDRPNIAWFVHRMKAGKPDLNALEFALRKDLASSEITELIQTMIFFDDVNVSLDALKHLRACLPPQLQGQIVAYHSTRSSNSKRRVLEEFRSGKIKVLLITEPADVGCDFPSIRRVIQFMAPSSLAVWLQRAGRAARSRLICGEAFLLVQPTVFQEKESYQSDESDDADIVVFKKDVEPGLRLWIETSGCRREVTAEYFNDGVTRSEPTGLCCDNCIRQSNPDHPMLQIEQVLPRAQSSDGESEGSMAPVPTRRHEHLEQARACLATWRDDTFDLLYSEQPWGPEALLPSPVLTAIATKAQLRTVEDLISIARWEEIFARIHGEEVLDLLSSLDHVHHTAVEQEKLEREEIIL
ncbi:P-loop containing nucleoside triphosphate hydrolase protein [Lentinula raphanica]|nr:P-loop containing nucleoside triphosphate hydrolase protein [Lentinula raphanica]KAJ3969146.1 P-loop containing nucleoside triphosphate hydrolase protein [Lentinula raphanica]